MCNELEPSRGHRAVAPTVYGHTFGAMQEIRRAFRTSALRLTSETGVCGRKVDAEPAVRNSTPIQTLFELGTFRRDTQDAFLRALK
ncbi:hypothetical protein Pcac1_g20430 [Phytophthora cactorum]|nr:hypothetical protein Pcac1_g20430 [Phytophthora cactorum]